MKKKFVCPYCFDENHINDIEFRCRNKRCPQEPDDKKGTYYGTVAPMEHRVFKTIGKISDRALCEKCNEQTNLRVCPNCHNSLPMTITSDRKKIISLIGTRDSGKSIYVTVLIHEFLKHIAPSLNGALNFVSPDDKEQYYSRFYNFLYKNRARIPQTASAMLSKAIGANRPILTKFKKEYKKFFSTKTEEFTLVFFDAAGEDFGNEDVMHTISKYIAHSDGIIFLIDPFSNNTVRGGLPMDAVQGASTIEANSVDSPKAVIERVADLVRFYGKSKGKIKKDKVNIPVAAAFSKLDAFETLLDNGAALRRPSPHLNEGVFVEQDGFTIDQEIRGLLAAWGEQDFLTSLSMNYANAKLFAFSALGSNPHPDGKIDEPIPNRIEDSLIWMLNELKLL
jgi:hypothetical protein